MYLGISYLFKKIQSVIVSCDTRRRCTKKISRKCKTDSLMRRSVFKKVSKTEDFRVELFLQVYLNLVNFVLDRIYEATKKFKWKSIVFLLGLFLSWIISLPVVIIRTKLFCVIFQFQVKSRYETAAGVQSWLRQVVKEPSKVIGRSTRKNSFSMILKPTGAIAFTRGYYFCQRCRCLYAYIFDELLSCRSNV